MVQKAEKWMFNTPKKVPKKYMVYFMILPFIEKQFVTDSGSFYG